MEERFSRVRSAKDIAISVVLLAAGIGLIVTPDSVPLNITGSHPVFCYEDIIQGFRDRRSDEKDREILPCKQVGVHP